jgi:hypothetical protein
MSGPDYPEHPADEIRSADEQRNKGRKFIGLSATCLIFIVCLAYVSHLFSGHRFSFFDFSGLVLFLLFIVVVDRIVLPRLDSLRQPDSLAEQDVAADGKIRALLDGLPAGCVVLHDVSTGEASIDHLVFRRDGAVFLIECHSHDKDGTKRNAKLFGKGFASNINQNAFWLRNQLKIRLGFEPWVHAAIVFFDDGVKSHFKVRGVSVVLPDSLLNWMNQTPGDQRLTANLWPQVEQLKAELSRPASIHLAPLMTLR